MDLESLFRTWNKVSNMQVKSQMKQENQTMPNWNFPLAFILGMLIWTQPACAQESAVSFENNSADTAETAAPNVLFISVDDLNDWIGCMEGHPQAKTPNLDRLAASGVLFTNAHCPAPACNPSRAAIMTGVSPNSRVRNARYSLPKVALYSQSVVRRPRL